MSTYPTIPADRDIEGEVIDTLQEAGFDLASDLAGAPRWLADRYYAARPLPHAGWLVANRPDPEAELLLQVLTGSGVIRSEARFDVTEIGAGHVRRCRRRGDGMTPTLVAEAHRQAVGRLTVADAIAVAAQAFTLGTTDPAPAAPAEVLARSLRNPAGIGWTLTAADLRPTELAAMRGLVTRAYAYGRKAA